MNRVSYLLHSQDLEQLKLFLKEEFAAEYESGGGEFFILAQERFYFRNNSTQLQMIVAKVVESKIMVDIVSSAGGAGLLNLNWGSEKKFLKLFLKKIEAYIKEHGIEWEELLSRSQFQQKVSDPIDCFFCGDAIPVNKDTCPNCGRRCKSELGWCE